MIKNIIKSVLSIALMITSVSCTAEQCKTKRVQHISEDNVKVWTTTICPNERLAFHTHDFARVIISKEDGILEVINKNKQNEKVILKKDTPVYLSKEQGLEPHQDLNLSDYPLHITVTELRY